jgi:hypothetical protein
MRHTITGLLSCLLSASAATAQLTSVPQFTGAYAEGFESPLVNGRVFHNHATVTASPGGYCMITNAWMQYVGYTVYSRNNSNSFLGSGTGYLVLTFDTPVQRFGAWFATVGYLAGGIARLYDDASNLIATQPLAAPRGTPWMWDGWDAGVLGPKIKRIELLANDPYNGGAMLCVEDAEMDIWLGTVTTRATGCGGLGIAVSGLPIVGDTLTFTMTGASAFAGYIVGARTSAPIGPCAGCTLGANGVNMIGSPYALDIPNRASLLDLPFAVQGFSIGTGPCLNLVKISDTIDVRVGA